MQGFIEHRLDDEHAFFESELPAQLRTVSFGSERAFRLRPWKRDGFRDFAARDGTVFVMPFATNLAFTHEVPHSAQSTGRRISVTLRAFNQER